MAYRRVRREQCNQMRLNAKGIKVMLSGRLAEMKLQGQNGYS